jgi:hypothetical protein
LALDLHLLDGDLRRQVMRFYNRLQSADRDVSRNIALPIAERQGGAVGAEVLRVELEQVRAGIERARETIPTLRRQLGHLLSVEEKSLAGACDGRLSGYRPVCRNPGVPVHLCLLVDGKDQGVPKWTSGAMARRVAGSAQGTRMRRHGLVVPPPWV